MSRLDISPRVESSARSSSHRLRVLVDREPVAVAARHRTKRQTAATGVLLDALGARRTHSSPARVKEALWTEANAVTVTRTVLATAALLLAIYEGSRDMLLAGLLISWIGDVVDGWLARRRACETVLGAQMDILADRLVAMLIVVGTVSLATHSFVPLLAAFVVWVQLGALDQLLSAQFLRFDLWSPDEFHLEDAAIWRINWAPAAKLVGNAPLGLLALGGSWAWVALFIAMTLIAVRSACYRQIALLARAREQRRVLHRRRAWSS